MRLVTALFLLLVLMLATGASKANIPTKAASPTHWRLVAETALDGKVVVRKPINKQRYLKAGQCARDGSLMGDPPKAANPRVVYDIACIQYKDEDTETLTP